MPVVPELTSTCSRWPVGMVINVCSLIAQTLPELVGEWVTFRKSSLPTYVLALVRSSPAAVNAGSSVLWCHPWQATR